MLKGLTTGFSKLPSLAKWGIGIGGSIVVIGITKRQLDKAEEKARLKKAEKVFQNANVPVTVNNADGTSVTVTLNTAVAATKIFDAIHNNDFFGWTEDETAIVVVLKAIPKAYIPDVAKHYKDLYKKNLQEEVVAALDQDEWEKVDYLFN